MIKIKEILKILLKLIKILKNQINFVNMKRFNLNNKLTLAKSINSKQINKYRFKNQKPLKKIMIKANKCKIFS
jgi:hypothetical protein